MRRDPSRCLDVVRPTGRPRRFVLCALLIAASTLLAGCSGDEHDTSPSAAEPGCGVLSASVLDGITGGASMQSFSGVSSRAERLKTGMTCSLIEKGAGDQQLLVKVNDEANAEDAARAARGVRNTVDRSACSSYATLKPAGYFCVLDDKVMAAVALDKRSMTMLIDPAPQQTVSPAAVSRAFAQIDDRLDAYDAKHS